jgi:hypothetical protein
MGVRRKSAECFFLRRKSRITGGETNLKTGEMNSEIIEGNLLKKM